jgi:ribose-phosphate pyrophosphokinase
MFTDYIKNRFDLAECVAVSPDYGGIKRAQVLADKLGLLLVEVDKQRDRDTGKVKVGPLTGNVEGKIALMFDDGLVTGSTLVQVAELLEKSGAKKNYFFATHGILVDLPLSTIKQAKVENVVITDSIYHKAINKKVKILSVAPLFANALRQKD